MWPYSLNNPDIFFKETKYIPHIPYKETPDKIWAWGGFIVGRETGGGSARSFASGL